MTAKLIITEKPSVASEIALALGGFKAVNKPDPTRQGGKRDVYLTNGKDIYISWAFGHLVQYDAKRPSDYSKLPVIPTKDEWQIKAISESHQFQLDVIEGLANSAEVTNIINACDAEREGELIFNLIMDACKTSRSEKKFERMWIQSMSKTALIQAFKDRKPASEYEGLNQAARSRAKADWLIGINASSAFSVIGERIWQNTQAAAIGRVKTATLAMIYIRHEKIKNFVPVKYWEIKGFFEANEAEYEGRWIDMTRYKIPSKEESTAKKADGEKPEEKNGVEECSRIQSQQQLDEILARILVENKLKAATNFKDIVVRKESNSPPLFNLLQAQVYAGKRFKYTAKKVLDIIQKLYEKKAVTYPRTDSSHLPNDYPNEAKSILKAISESTSTQWSKFADQSLDGVDNVGKRVFNDDNVSDHFAIIPTTEVPKPSDLTDEEKNIYGMIVNRFKAVFLPPLISDVTTRFTFIGDKDAFRSSGTVIIQKGWTEIEERDDKDNTLPKVGDVADIKSKKHEPQEKKTQPPKLYTEPDLLLAMKNAGRDLEDSELVEIMDGKGIGTPATRAQIIEELLANTTSKGKPKQPMMVREKNSFIPTEYGCKIIETLMQQNIFELINPKFTGQWEYDLDKVKKDAKFADTFMQNTEKTVVDIVDKLKTLIDKYPAPKFNSPCRKCGSDMEIGRYKITCTNTAANCDFAVSRSISGHNFTINELELFVKFGKTTEFYNFTSRDGEPFIAGLQFSETHGLKWMYPPDVERKEPCPCCGGVMVDRPKLIKCLNENCKLAVFKVISSKTISEKHISQLLTKKKTETITGFFSEKKKSKFDAELMIDMEKKQVNFAPFNNDGTPTDFSCLKTGCSGKYTEKRKVFECSEKCGSVIFKSSYNTDIPPTKMNKLLAGETISITGKRKSYEDGKEKQVSQAMNLHIDTEDGKVKAQFINPAKK